MSLSEFLLVGLAVLIALVAAETVLRLTPLREALGPGQLERHIEQELARHSEAPLPTPYRADALLGWAFKSDVSLPSFLEHYEHPRLTTNSLAMYGHEPDPAKSPVLALGDSFVEGISVPLDRHFASLLEDRFPAHAFLNLGVSGYGTVQSFLHLKARLKTFAARAVLFFVYFGNDFEENYVLTNRSMLGVPDYQRRHVPFWRGGGVVYGSEALGAAERRLRNLHLYSLLRAGLERLGVAEHPGMAVAREVIAEMAADLGQRNITLAVVLVPTDAMVGGRDGGRDRARYRQLRAFLDHRGISAVSLLEPFQESGRTTMGYLDAEGRVLDEHWNSATHELVAAILERHLAGLLR